MKTIFVFSFLIIAHSVFSQVVNTATMDTTDYQLKGKLTVEGYLDIYYAYNFNKPIGKEQPYFVSMARHNEVNVNLAFIDVKFSSSRIRARIAPGFGTYMNANYSAETGTLKNFVEANVGYRLNKRKNIWLDIGVLGSPYTNESAISKDHLTYTRSFAAENVPYYLSGVKLTVPLSRKVNTYFYLLNGWQQISDQNANKSLGTQLEFRPNDQLLINWNTYIGKEQSIIDSVQGNRYFSDLFLIWNTSRWSVTTSMYAGIQQANSEDRVWWQANVIGRYTFTSKLSLAGRVEYFSDNDGVLIVPITLTEKFSSYGTSLCLNLNADTNLLFRLEGRYLLSDDKVYLTEGVASNNSFVLTTSVCFWF